MSFVHSTGLFRLNDALRKATRSWTKVASFWLCSRIRLAASLIQATSNVSLRTPYGNLFA
jgi:hypothetical protein